MVGRRKTFKVVSLVLGVIALCIAAILSWAWPRLLPSPLERGRVAYQRGEWSVATDLTREALKARPEDREALRLLARCYGRIGRDESVDAIYRRLGPEGMEAEDYFIIAACLQRQGDLRSAFRILEKSLEADPKHADALHDLSRFCASADQLDRAKSLAARLALIPGQEIRASMLQAEILDCLLYTSPRPRD